MRGHRRRLQDQPIAFGPRQTWRIWVYDSFPTIISTAWTRNQAPNTYYNLDGAINQEWPDVIAPAPGAVATYNYAVGGTAMVRTVGFPRDGKTAYLSFGHEGIHREFYWDTPVPLPFCDNYRHKILMNAANWMRTSTIYGRVTTSASGDMPPGSPRPGALVVASGRSTGRKFGVFADSDGLYRFRGLPVDVFDMTAQYSGQLADHDAVTETWGKGPKSLDDARLMQDVLAPPEDTTFQRREDFNLLPAPPGALEGFVYSSLDLDGDGNFTDPVPGIEVRASSLTLDPPLTGDPVFDEVVVTDEDGYYFIGAVPVDTYDVHANPRLLLNYSDQLAPDVLVQAGQTERVDFTIEPLPGTITGTVTDRDTNAPVASASVSIDAPTMSTTTDSAGLYTLEDVPAGTHTVDVDAPGYRSASAQVVLVPGGTVTKDFELEQVPPGSVSGRVTDSTGTVGVPGVLVRALFGGQPLPGVEPVTTGDDGTYEMSLPASVYTIQAYDPAGEAAYDPVDGIRVTIVSGGTVEDVNFQIIPQASFPEGLHIIGPAYTYEGRNPAGILGVSGSQLNLASWVPARGDYAVYAPDNLDPEVNTLTRGRGYFALFANRVEISAVGTPPPADTDARRQTVTLALSADGDGWNLIGNPYDFDIDFSLTRVRSGGQEMSLAEAAASGIVSDVMFTYENGYRKSNLLPAWRGAWVRVNEPGVSIALSNQRVVTQQVLANARNMLREDMHWQVQLFAESGRQCDGATWFGAAAAADSAYDAAYDVPEPPSLRSIAGAELSVHFPHTDYGIRSGRYASDVRAKVQASETWDVGVESVGLTEPVRLSWPDMRSLPRYYSATLTDLDSGKQVNMRTSESHTFAPGDSGKRDLRITVRRSSPGGGLVIVGVGRQRGMSTVSYRAMNDAVVDVKVLNAAGRIIRRVVEGEVRAAGTHTETWDGRNEKGSTVPTGQYTIEIRGVFEDGTITRATTRLVR